MTNNFIIDEDIKNILSENLPWHTLSGKSFLITGAAGFIASYIVDTLLCLGDIKIYALVRSIDKAKIRFNRHLNNKNLIFIEQDIAEPLKIDISVDYIIHAASQASPRCFGTDPVGTLKANTIGTYNCLEFARKSNIIKFIFISTCEVYGQINDSCVSIDETCKGSFDTLDIRSCYSESKKLGENMCVAYSSQYGINSSIIRPAHTYGPGLSLDDGRSFCDFVKNVVQNENIILNSDGKSKRKYLYITDFVKGLFFILFCGNDKEAYNITADDEISVAELAETILTLRPDKHSKVEYHINNFSNGYLKSKSTSAPFISDKLKKLGWRQSIDIKTGFDRMLRYYE